MGSTGATGVTERKASPGLKSRMAAAGKDGLRKTKRHWQLYLLVLLPLAYIIIFKYVPMYGAQIAFRDFSIMKGFAGSDWAGLKHFQDFFQSPNFSMLIENTLLISLYSLLVGFPAPIILALALNEAGGRVFKKRCRW
ncbi:hypothetical protein PACILC2_18600 [Paenibacillus cisolokensis]|uniref:ABC transmembrane type-1 domain-containing protein n=1 Tax=Paenibacillus cisolokensis TaxID=1658519 RepID=A0ABQ4N573_9BACL|nr:hypothetical protein PACILC2_18600 [Paenibacillus cisolokensis]